jgi:hypothetical protein
MLRKFSQHLQQFPPQWPPKTPNRYGSPTVEVFLQNEMDWKLFAALYLVELGTST